MGRALHRSHERGSAGQFTLGRKSRLHAFSIHQGGTTLRVLGEGFANRSDSECVFGGDLRAAATWVSPSEVQCLAPPVNASSGKCEGDQLEVAIVPGAETRNTVTLLRTATPRLLSVQPATGFYRSAQWVRVYGYGFVASQLLSCLFYAEGVRILVTVPDVMYVSQSEVACLQPVLEAALLMPSYLEVSVDGQVWNKSGLASVQVGVG